MKPPVVCSHLSYAAVKYDAPRRPSRTSYCFQGQCRGTWWPVMLSTDSRYDCTCILTTSCSFVYTLGIKQAVGTLIPDGSPRDATRRRRPPCIFCICLSTTIKCILKTRRSWPWSYYFMLSPQFDVNIIPMGRRGLRSHLGLPSAKLPQNRNLI